MHVGDIIYIELILFKKGIDHGSKKGRPCVYIGEKNDNMYFIPLKGINEKNFFLSCRIKPDKRNKLKKISTPNFDTIIKKSKRFFEVYGYLDDTSMEKVMLAIVSYFKETPDEDTKAVKFIAEEYLNAFKEEMKYVDKDTKKKQDKII